MGVLHFTKMHGAGNDFVMVAARDLPAARSLAADRIAALCNRRTGIGADGLIIVGPAAAADVRMDYFNADGGGAAMCGNGARCTIAFAHQLGLVGETGTLATASGDLAFRVHGPSDIEVDLPAPRDLTLNIALAGSPYAEHHACNTGVPHLVIPVADVEAVDVAVAGPLLRWHPHFAPLGTNVDWISKSDREGVWRLRTFERGVEAETLACGTGAAAAAAVLVSLAQAASPVAIRTSSGDHLRLSVDPGVSRLALRGPAVMVFAGEVAEHE